LESKYEKTVHLGLKDLACTPKTQPI
jgi:hypothetical protein